MSGSHLLFFIVLSLFYNFEMINALRGRIVNGSQALEGEFPFMLSLRRFNSGRHLCGASVLNSGWALTAAHCVSGTFPARINVQFGSNELDSNSSSIVNVSKIFVHEGYFPHNNYIHDIALLKLKTPLEFGARVRAIRLPEMQQVTAGNQTATLIGWGHNEVSLRHASNFRHFCAGTIIDDDWILTAAHCFTFIKNPDEVKIQIASTKLNPVNPIMMDISKIIKHEGYNPTVAIHDIALLRLRTPISNNASITIQPVNLTNNINFIKSTEATLIGWGLEKLNGSLHDHLQKVQLNILTIDDCRSKLPAFVHHENLCAYSMYKGQCSGDSGGPILMGNTQIGIVSWSLKPCGLYPGVFTNIEFYKKWIKNTIQSE